MRLRGDVGVVRDKMERESTCWFRCGGNGEVLLRKLHKLGGIWGPVVGGVVSLIENGMACAFQFARSAVFEPDIPVGCGETQEDTGGGVVHVQFGATDAGLLHGHVAAENSDM